MKGSDSSSDVRLIPAHGDYRDLKFYLTCCCGSWNNSFSKKAA